MTAWRRTNYRGRTVSLLGGPIAIALLGLLATSDLALLVAVLGAGVVGLGDDLHGDPGPKGFGGHLRALAHGRVTSGVAKILGIGMASLAAALLMAGGRPLAGAVVIAGCANLLNLFDLRPGRALKVALLVALPLRAWAVAVPAALLLWPDLRERLMLGDAGANAFGAALGVRLAVAEPVWPVVAVVVGLTLLSEWVSFSRVVDAVPPLRWLDRLGRAA